MKSLRWIAVLIMLAFCDALSFADVVPVPPDGNIGTKSGGSSIPITSLTQPLTFSPCAGATGDVAFDCALFGGAQQIFAGVNETGFAWNSISIGLSNYNPITDPNVTCDGGSIFQKCSTSVSGSTLTVNFLQGTGTGVGCYNTVNPLDPMNLKCFLTSAAAISSNEHHGTDLPYSILPIQSAGPCKRPEDFPRGAVCGSDEFVIGIGYGSGNAFNQPLSLDASFSADPAPEPPTLVLFGSAMLAMLLFGIKKARLA